MEKKINLGSILAATIPTMAVIIAGLFWIFQLQADQRITKTILETHMDNNVVRMADIKDDITLMRSEVNNKLDLIVERQFDLMARTTNELAQED